MKTGLTDEKVSFPLQKLKVLRKCKAVNDSLIFRIAHLNQRMHHLHLHRHCTVFNNNGVALAAGSHKSPVGKWLSIWTSNQKVIGSSPIGSTWNCFF